MILDLDFASVSLWLRLRVSQYTQREDSVSPRTATAHLQALDLALDSPYFSSPGFWSPILVSSPQHSDTLKTSQPCFGTLRLVLKLLYAFPAP
jgi:hypothetical protein